MKKIIITILVLLLVAGGGTAYYFLKVKTYDISQDAALEEITEDDYDIVLPPEDDTTAAEVNPGDNSATVNPSGNANGAQASDKTTQPAPAKVTVATIKERYRPSFESLESQANGKINALVGRAISEYKEQKASGEKISYSYFITKYKTAGETLEAKTDQAFNRLYGALQQDLKKHGFDPNEAADIRAAYESSKKERKNALISSAMEKM